MKASASGFSAQAIPARVFASWVSWTAIEAG